MPKKTPSLAQKIAWINKQVAVIERGGTNEEERYKYARVGDILQVVEPLMWEQRLILTANEWAGSALMADTCSFPRRIETPKGSIVDLMMYWKLEDVDSGESRIYAVPGAGWGRDEKGCQKAITGSRKSAITLIFGLRIADWEEPEHDREYPIDREEASATAQDLGREKVAKLRETEAQKVAKRTAEIKEQMASGTGQA